MPEFLSRRDPIDVAYLPIRAFAEAANMSTGTVRNLMASGSLHGVKDGRVTKIRETPRQHLESLPAFQPGTMQPGPGRPRKTQA